MTTTGRDVRINEDVFHPHDHEQAPLVHTDPSVSETATSKLERLVKMASSAETAAAIELLERWAQMASGAVWKNIFNGMSLDATTLAADTRKFLSVIKCPAQE